VPVFRATDGCPPDGFTVHTVDPELSGVLFQNRLVALNSHVVTKQRTWKRLWMWPRARREIVIQWLYVIPR